MGKFIEEHKATIGADFLTKDLTIEDKMITLQIWDTAGQERFQSLGNAFYRGADACVLVFDITSSASFAKIEEWKSNFLEQSGTEHPSDFPFLLLGNKHDLAAQKREVSEAEASQYAQANNMVFRETSAVNGHNIEAALREISDRASEMDSAPIFRADVLTHDELEKTYGDAEEADEPASEAAGCACQML